MPFLEGYGIGLSLIVLIGPVLFVLLRSTLERGRASGFAVALGIFVSDVVAVTLCALGGAHLLASPELRPWLALGGGLLLLGMGVRYLTAPPLSLDSQPAVRATSLMGFFARGFLVNFINPFVFLVWIGIIGGATARHGPGWPLALFLAGAVFGVLTLDSLKVLLAARIRPLLRPSALKVIFRGSGVLLLGFGARLIYVGVTG